MFQSSIINIVRDAVVRSYNCLKLNTEAVVKEVEELFKDNYFMLGGLVSILCFTMPN